MTNHQKVRIVPDHPNEKEDFMIGDYLPILAKDYRTLTIMAKRFKKVSLLHGEMLKEMECILARYPHSQSCDSTNQQHVEYSPPFNVNPPFSFMNPNCPAAGPPFPMFATPNATTNNLIDFGVLLSQNNESMNLPLQQEINWENCHLHLDVEEIQDIYFNDYQ
ncbi:predicted protein [Naegleria gruberi]|uniref:Predicted protein n=1 Tax=Naegleria gruberi TaxID=5762 RepID=D2W2S6_NAEGR|nr:uncharacterized protein NAEGRDRAFT_75696 [Naegleria gruberi]EFC36565.1 predicted protein [Naegleria gruberi]|eukprot:XP_002669309.1 predicted protein [Naegleria gruberi strain NEG-M]